MKEQEIQRTADEKIRALAKDLGVSQIELSIRLGLSGATIPGYLAVKRVPSGLPCLLLAGLSERVEDRRFWIQASGLSAAQLALVRRGLDMPLVDSGEIADIVDNPRDSYETALAVLIKQAVDKRNGGRK